MKDAYELYRQVLDRYNEDLAMGDMEPVVPFTPEQFQAQLEVQINRIVTQQKISQLRF